MSEAFEKPFGPASLSVNIAGQSFTTLVDSGAAKSCISVDIRRRLKKVLAPLSCGQFLRMGNGELVQPLGCCTTSVLVQRDALVVLFTVLQDCVADVIFFIVQHSTY